MRILLGRHGESEGNKNPRKYIEKGEAVDLTPHGWLQGQAQGKFLEGYYPETGTKKWPVIYMSPLPRPKQTLMAAWEGGLKNVFPGKPKIYEDPRLIEKYFGAASHLYHQDENLSESEKAVRSALLTLSKEVYKLDPYTAANLFGNSSLDKFIAVKSLIDGTLARDIQEGKDDFLIICHGATIQAFIMAWAHLPISAKDRLGNPDNCDLIEISGEPKNWKIRRIYDGKNMVAVDEDATKSIKPFSFDDLPPVPPEFLLK